jgi:hypothetical protein
MSCCLTYVDVDDLGLEDLARGVPLRLLARNHRVAPRHGQQRRDTVTTLSLTAEEALARVCIAADTVVTVAVAFVVVVVVSPL